MWTGWTDISQVLTKRNLCPWHHGSKSNMYCMSDKQYDDVINIISHCLRSNEWFTAEPMLTNFIPLKVVFLGWRQEETLHSRSQIKPRQYGSIWIWSRQSWMVVLRNNMSLSGPANCGAASLSAFNLVFVVRVLSVSLYSIPVRLPMANVGILVQSDKPFFKTFLHHPCYEGTPKFKCNPIFPTRVIQNV